MRNNQAFVHGSNAVKVDTLFHDDNVNQDRQSTEVYKTNRKGNKTKSKVSKMPVVYTCVLSLVIGVTVATLVLLLKSQFTVAAQSQKVIELQKDLVVLKSENEKLASNIDKSVNMDEIYRIATEELEMIQPSADNIKYIEPTVASYTIQYTNIDVVEEQGIDLGSFLGFISSEW